MDITLRKADASDIEYLLKLRDITMRGYLLEAGLPANQEAYLSRIHYQFENARIIELTNRSVGLFKAVHLPESHQWQLIQIQIHPDYQNLKIGRFLIKQLIDKALAAGDSVGLSVLKSNPALRLYLRLGFRRIGESAFDYELLLQA